MVLRKNSFQNGSIKNVPCSFSDMTSNDNTLKRGKKFKYRWKIENIGYMYADKLKGQYLSCIQSKPFTLSTSASDHDQVNDETLPKFCVQFFPHGIHNYIEKNEVSLYLHLLTDHKVSLKATFYIIDCDSEKRNKQGTILA